MAETATEGGAIRLREYETVLLIKPEVSDEGVERIKERIRSTVARDGGKVLKFTHWGKKKTAFPVAKQQRAIFVHANFLGGPKTVAEIERNLAISEDVTKFMSQRLADNVDPETRQVEPDVKLTGDADERPRTEREAAPESQAAAPESQAAAPESQAAATESQAAATEGERA